MIPDYQTLMLPVLKKAAKGEVRISDVVEALAKELELTVEEQEQLLPSGKQTTFANRVHWAKTYLTQADLVRSTRRAHFIVTERGKEILATHPIQIDNELLQQFEEFRAFRARSKILDVEQQADTPASSSQQATPDEEMRNAHARINAALADEILERVRQSSPAFFERLIVQLLLAMGYGGTTEGAGRAIGKSGDDGIDGVIDQDPLGVDQIYIQAKRYQATNSIGAGAVRDFFGALSLKRATKGIFVTTSSFSQPAIETARGLGSRIVLIDGQHLARLLIRYNVGSRDEEVLRIKKLDDDFFE